MHRPTSSRPPQSVGRRLRRWIALAFAVAITGLTATAVVEEHRLVRGLGAANGDSLVTHLASMPEFRANRAAALAHAAQLDSALRGAGIRLDVVPASTPPSSDVIASRTLELEDGPVVLRYRSDAQWLTRVVRRALTFHLAVGAVTLAILLGGTEWILRTRLVAPLRRIAHQVRFMRAGGGWNPRLPASDTELADLSHALEELGPAIHAQVEEWLEGERRAAAAGALGTLRERLREPQRRALALLGDLQARALVTPAAMTKVRAIVSEVDRINREIGREEEELFGPARRRSATPSAPPDTPTEAAARDAR